MAMTTCPQCDGEMSGYALSCPHCGKMNPAAPQAILLQEKRENLSPQPLKVSEPSHTIEADTIRVSERPTRGLGFGIQWVEELCAEWNALEPVKKTALQVLFGFAFVVGIFLFVYAMVA